MSISSNDKRGYDRSLNLEIDKNQFNTQGDGDPDCPICKGVGKIEILDEETGLPKAKRCKCALKKDWKAHLEKTWAGLSSAKRIKKSNLPKLVNQDLWITSQETAFREHLRYTMFRQPLSWFVRVVGDTRLATAWFANMAIKGEQIIDAEVAASISLEAISLTDLVVPPDLLIIQLGVKVAPMSRMGDLVEETLRERKMAGKPTWLLDHPSRPLDVDHICFSETLMDYLLDWDHVRIKNKQKKKMVSLEDDGAITSSVTTGSALPETTRQKSIKNKRTKPKSQKVSR
ncbi:MAG: hypothetical protein AAGM67_02035 [Bacteroidota bacterium]